MIEKQSSDKLVSILIPTKNSGSSLALTLESIRNQTYKNIEVIVSDSFSTDNTGDIVHKFGNKLSLCEGRVLAARLDGINKAEGEFIILLDSDQQMVKDCVDNVVAKMNEGYDMLFLEEIALETKGLIANMWKKEKENANKDFFKKIDPLD